MKTPKRILTKLEQLLQDLPRCQVCGQVLIATCDLSKPSELVEVAGTLWTEKNPQFMWFYPTAEKQSTFCFHHQNPEVKSWKPEGIFSLRR